MSAFTWLLTKKGEVARFPNDTVVGVLQLSTAEAEKFVDGIVKQCAEEGKADVQIRIPIHAVQFAAIKVKKKLKLIAKPGDAEFGPPAP